MKAADVEFREKPGATVCGCCVGEDSGELLASDDRSEALEMETSCQGIEESDSASMPKTWKGKAACTGGI